MVALITVTIDHKQTKPAVTACYHNKCSISMMMAGPSTKSIFFSIISFLLIKFSHQSSSSPPKAFGRISPEEYILTPEQIEKFHSNGCCTLPNVLTPEEVDIIETTFNQFLNREIHTILNTFLHPMKNAQTAKEDCI